MALPVLQMFVERDPVVRRQIFGLYALLIFVNLAVWGWAFYTFHSYPAQLGTALFAYTLGLRHAVDADHIAAIDNVTRKLMQDGKRPIAVGLFFSLGHSTIVVFASVAIAATATAFKSELPFLHEVGGIVGTSVSALFLLAIAFMNIFVLAAIYRTFKRVKASGICLYEDLDLLMVKGGALACVFRPIFKMIRHSWQMYPLGFLFGLGFDTASEVGLLGVSAAGVAHGLPLWSILVFPALFTAGMSLVDTTDGVLMVGAYGWAFVEPIRKLYYNMTITFVSIIIALIVGGLEALNLVGDQLHLEGAFWDRIGAVNDHFGMVGYAIVGIFVSAWAISYLMYRAKDYGSMGVGTATWQ